MDTLIKCEHKFVTEIDTKIKDFEHPLICDDCNTIIECEHEYELNDYKHMCWVCGHEMEEE